MNFIKLVFRYLCFLVRVILQKNKLPKNIINFKNDIIKDDRLYYAYNDIEKIREILLNNDKKITVTDFGAGSKIHKSNERKISSIAKYSLKPPKYSQLFFRIVNSNNYKTIIELGTSLGITSSYLAYSKTSSKLYTFEGCPSISNIAKDNFLKLNLKNIEVITGNFDITLEKNLDFIKELDFAFIDGNHKKDPTLRYFNILKKYANSNSLFIFDDIHWSDEMNEAWNFIKNDKEIAGTIDLFHVGLVFFNKEFINNNYYINY